MDEILTVAKRLGMGVIPVINSPGHMDGILNAMEALGIKIHSIAIIVKINKNNRLKQ